MSDHGAGSDYAPIADGDSRKHCDVSAQPAIVAYRNGQPPDGQRSPLESITGVVGGDEMTVGTDLGMISSSDVPWCLSDDTCNSMSWNHRR